MTYAKVVNGALIEAPKKYKLEDGRLILNFNLDNIFYYININLVIFTFLFLLKDLVFRNASIGKRALNLEILKSDNTVPSVSTLILRNIFVFL